MAGVRTPAVDGLIAPAPAMDAEEYRGKGRTLSTMALGGLYRDALLRTVDEGDRGLA